MGHKWCGSGRSILPSLTQDSHMTILSASEDLSLSSKKCKGALRPGQPRFPCSAGAELGNELKGLTAKSFRKCYRLWGKAHLEQSIRDGVDWNQDHSTDVAESNYDVSAHQEAAFIAGGFMDAVRASSSNEAELMPPPTVRIIL